MKKLLLGAIAVGSSFTFAQQKQSQQRTLSKAHRAITATEVNFDSRMANVKDTIGLMDAANTFIGIENGGTGNTVYRGLECYTDTTDAGLSAFILQQDPSADVNANTLYDYTAVNNFPNETNLTVEGVSFLGTGLNTNLTNVTAVVTVLDGVNPEQTKEVTIPADGAINYVSCQFDTPFTTDGDYQIVIKAKTAGDSLTVFFSDVADAASTIFPYASLGGFNEAYINSNDPSSLAGTGSGYGYAFGANQFGYMMYPWVSYSFTNDVSYTGECFVENTLFGADVAKVLGNPYYNQNKFNADVTGDALVTLNIDYGDGNTASTNALTDKIGYGYSAAGTYTITSTAVLKTWYVDADMNGESDDFTDVLTASQTCTSGVGINENEMNVATYPNPAYNEFNIELNNAIEGTVNVLDLTGKVVIAQELNGANTTLNVANLNNGLYIYQIETAEGVVATGKFSKK